MLGKTALGASSPAKPACEDDGRQFCAAQRPDVRELSCAYLDHTGTVVAHQGADISVLCHFDRPAIACSFSNRTQTKLLDEYGNNALICSCSSTIHA
jgi:hypothetical protein